MSHILSAFKRLFVFIAPILGMVLGTAIFTVGTGTTYESQEILKSREFFVWVLLNDFLIALYLLLMSWLWKDLYKLRKYLLKNKFEVALFVIIFLGLYSTPFVV